MDINVINKDNLPTASIKDFKPLQGSLKTLSDENYNKLKKSIEKYGFFVPIFVWNGYIMDGHGRREVIIGEGWDIKVPYVNIEAKDIEEAKDKLLHITSQYNTITIEGLQEFNPNWGELSINFDAISISKEEPKLEAKEDDFDATPPSEPKTVLGDIYEIGEHRLLCGDSTQTDTFAKLMQGEMADMVVTDPPYNVAYEGGTKDALTIENDSMGNDEFYKFLYDFYTALTTAVKKGGAIYVWHSSSEIINFGKAMVDAGWLLKQQLIWVKNAMVMGRQDYQWKHEPCLYGWLAGRSHKWYSDRKQTTVIGWDKPLRNGEHPTMKPIGLFAYQIQNSSKKGDIVIHAFGGSGTTMVACEQTYRKARLVEYDPKYCDVIITRMLKLDPSLIIKRNGEVIEW